MKLLTVGNPKIAKGEKLGYLTAILHLAPHKLSGYNTCPMATAGCSSACLNTAGRGGMVKIGETTNYIQIARIRKTRMFFENRDAFMCQLVNEVANFVKLAEKYELIPAVRLNGTSDIRWEVYPVTIDGILYPNIMSAFSNVQFYDYTKIPNRRHLPSNYHLTFSLADGNECYAEKAIDNGLNIAVVFRKGGPRVKVVKSLEEKLADRAKRESRKGMPKVKRPSRPRKVDLTWLPNSYMGLSVFYGDTTDLRFLDPRGSVIALVAKGEAKYDTTGFVKDVV